MAMLKETTNQIQKDWIVFLRRQSQRVTARASDLSYSCHTGFGAISSNDKPH